MKQPDQKITVGKLDFIGRTVAGGWVRWYPANEAAMDYLESYNSHLLPRLQRDFLKDEGMRELCSITGQEFKGRDTKCFENRIKAFEKVSMWIDREKERRKNLAEEVISGGTPVCSCENNQDS